MLQEVYMVSTSALKKIEILLVCAVLVPAPAGCLGCDGALGLAGDSGDRDAGDIGPDRADEGGQPDAPLDLEDAGPDGRDAVDVQDGGGDMDGDDAPLCGNGVLDEGEECDTFAPEPCPTGCGSQGLKFCEACRWSDCRIQPETCNGMDDDCNGFTDSYSPSGLLTRVTDTPGISGAPNVIFTGSEFGVVWMDDFWSGRVTYARMSTDGAMIGGKVSISESSDARCFNFIDTVFTGSEFISLWWSFSATIYMARFTPIGEILLPETQVGWTGLSGNSPTVAVAGSEAAFTWREGDESSLCFARVTLDGEKIGGDVLVAADGGNGQMFYNGGELAVIYSHRASPEDGIYELVLARFAPEGTRIGEDIVIGAIYECYDRNVNSPVKLFSAVDTGSAYGLIWQDRRGGDYGNCELYFSLVSHDGARLAEEVRLTEAEGPSVDPYMVYTGRDFSFVWRDRRADVDSLYFNRITADGTLVDDELRVIPLNTVPPNFPVHPYGSAAFSGDRYAVAWFDLVAGNWDVYATILTCP
jgi:hypothetical protein